MDARGILLILIDDIADLALEGLHLLVDFPIGLIRYTESKCAYTGGNVVTRKQGLFGKFKALQLVLANHLAIVAGAATDRILGGPPKTIFFFAEMSELVNVNFILHVPNALNYLLNINRF